MIPENHTDVSQVRHPAAAVLFLAGLAAGLWRAAPGLGWGAQPGFAVSAHLLAPGPDSGAGPFLLLAALARLAPGGDFAFALNALAAAAFALAAVLIFYAAVRVSGTLIISAAVWAVFILLPCAAAVFDAARPEAGVVLAAAAMLFAGARHVGPDAGPRGLAAFLALGVVAGLHHFLIGAIVVLAAALCMARLPREQLRPGWAAALGFVFLAALAPLAFAALRPRFGIMWGAGWIQAPMEVFNLPGPSLLAETFRPGPALFFALKQLPEWFIAAPGARYFYMLGAGLVGLVAMRPGRRGFAPLFGAMFLLAPLSLVLSTIRNPDLFRCLLLAPFVLFFAAGSGAILREMDTAGRAWIKAVKPLALALLLAAAAWGVGRAPRATLERRPAMAAEFAAQWHMDLRRDAAAFINPEQDLFYAPPAVSLILNVRRDITYLFPREFNSPSYRAMQRERAGSALAIPSEQQYEQLKNTVTESTKAPEGAPEDSALMKQRVLYNLMMLNQTIMAEETALRRPVYFNTISMFLRNERFNWMCLLSERMSFRACHTLFAHCVDDYLSASPDIRARVLSKKRELMADRNFLEKAVENKYRGSPEYAAPVMALLNRYFENMGNSGNPDSPQQDPWDEGNARDALAKFLGVEDQIRQKVIYPYVALIQEATMGCDSARDGFSMECVARSIMDIMGRTDMDLFPMPESATFCFIKCFHWPWAVVKLQMMDAMHSPLRRDPVAAQLLAGHLADAAEHAWIHNNDYLADDDPRMDSIPLQAGYRAALRVQTAGLWMAAIMGRGDMRAIPPIAPPVVDEPHLQLLLENAVRLSPESLRSRFLLAMVAMAGDPHGRLAQEQLETVERMLTEREKSRGLDDYEMYMLVEVYQKMGLRDQADKYLERLEGGSRLPIY
jgi:hypothetical protein